MQFAQDFDLFRARTVHGRGRCAQVCRLSAGGGWPCRGARSRSTGGSRGAGGLDERRALRLLISWSELCRPESSTPSCGQEACRAGTAARSDARVPGRARCARTRRAPAAARGHQRSATVSGFYYVGLPFQRSFASATLRRRRRCRPRGPDSSEAAGCAGWRVLRSAEAQAATSKQVLQRPDGVLAHRLGKSASDRSRRWPNDTLWGRRCGRPAQPARALERTPAV